MAPAVTRSQDNSDPSTSTTIPAMPSTQDTSTETASPLSPVPSTLPTLPTTQDNMAPRHASSAPTFVTANTRESRLPEPKVASPEYYSGQRSKLNPFITQVTMVIILQPSRFQSEEAKILYAGSFLRDTAFLWFQPFVTADPKPDFMTNFQLFCKELQQTFGDPDAEASAERQLYNLKQKGSVTSYLADFNRYAVLVKWNDEAKAAQFYRGLKDPIKDELIRAGRPHNLKEMQDTAIRIDSRFFERRLEKGEQNAVTTNTFSTSRFTPRSSTTTFTKSQSTVTRPTSTFTRPPITENMRMITPPTKDRLTRSGKLTPAEYQRRKENKLCLYCGDKGHQVSQCPIAPARPNQQLRAMSDSQNKAGAPKDLSPAGKA